MAEETGKKPEEKESDPRTETKDSCGCGCVPPVKTE